MRRASSASQNEAATLDNLSFQLVELRLTLESLERERDFYFSKLTAIEKVVDDCGDNRHLQVVRDILYEVSLVYGLECSGSDSTALILVNSFYSRTNSSQFRQEYF